MSALFWGAATLAALATLFALTRANLVHGLVGLVASFGAVAAVFLSLGAPLTAALEVVLYAGAIVVLFVFVVVLLGAGAPDVSAERRLIARAWLPLAIVAAGALAAELGWALHDAAPGGALAVAPEAVGAALFGPYAAAVELASLLLLGAAVAALRLGRAEGGA